MLATTYDLPVNPAYTAKTLSPVVAVLGRPGRVAGLAGHLPSGWRVRNTDGFRDIRPGEIVLIAGAAGHDVTMARKLLPSHTLVALVDMDAPAETVAEVLTAGADVCVRGGTPAILASHLVACRRRQLTDRWSTLNHNLTAS